MPNTGARPAARGTSAIERTGTSAIGIAPAPSSICDMTCEPVGPLVHADADTLITLARCHDGQLQMAMEPATPGAEVTLHFSRLTPGRHRLHGEGVDVTVTAADDGTAHVSVALAGHVALVLEAAS